MADTAPGRRPLVSFVLIGRNDDYRGDYLYRLGTCLSFLARNAERVGLLDDIEVLVVDWASERPLARVLPLVPAARRITAFLEVTPDLVRSRVGAVRWIPTCAINVGVRRAKGEFILSTDSDCLWSEAAMAALGRLARGQIALPVPVEDLFCYVRRHQVPWATVHRRPRLDEWTRLVALLAAGVQPERAGISCLGGFSAGQLMHRDLWYDARGYDESLDRPWGWSDNDLMLRVSQRHPWLDVSGHGLIGLHMEHGPQADARNARDQSTVNPMVIRNESAVNGPQWGLAGLEIPATMATSNSEPMSGFGCAVPLSGTLASSVAENWNPAPDAVDFVRRIGAEGELPAAPVDRLAAVAQIARTDLPRNLYWFGAINPAVLMTILRACPACEVFFANPWPDGVSDALALHPGEFAKFLEVRARFKGWARIVQGAPATVLDRIEHSSVGTSPIELAWFESGTSLDLVRAVADRLAPGGVALCPIEGDRATALERLTRAAPGCVTQVVGNSGLVAATRPDVAKAQQRADLPAAGGVGLSLARGRTS
jgi:hypothetical protein